MTDYTKTGHVGVATRGTDQEYIDAALALESALGPVTALDMYVAGEPFVPVLKRVIGHLQSCRPGVDWNTVGEPTEATTLAVYECEPIGVDDTLEAVNVRWFCSETCREKWPKDPAFRYGTDENWIEGTVCDECAKPLGTDVERAA